MNRFAQPPRPMQSGPKPFSWSYSKLKNFESCPLKHQQVDLLKNFSEVRSEQLDYGDDFHDAMKKGVTTAPHKLPEKFKDYQWFLDKLTSESNPLAIIIAEQKLAINKAFQPCGYFDSNAWFRCIIDYAKFVPVDQERQIVLTVDYKTGKMLDDPVQLALSAQCIFSHFPQTVKARTEYFWAQDQCTTREDFTPADMLNLWTIMNPRVDAMEQAWLTGQYVPVKSGLCKRHCPVSNCVNNGSYTP